jgi:predicted GH43/DUF377 family glycosyl hydrolase
MNVARTLVSVAPALVPVHGGARQLPAGERRPWSKDRGWTAVCLLVLVACSGCGRYADFTLPRVSGGNPGMKFAADPQPHPNLVPTETWESHDILNPSVIRGTSTADGFLNFYSGFDGQTWRTGVATSEDGYHWRKHGAILSPDPQTWEGSYIAANGSALLYSGRFWYWYQSGPKGEPRVGLARSSDTRTWRKEPSPVLDRGPYGSWDERGIADPYVIRIDPYFYLYYLGQDRARRQRLGLARSPDGLHWEKLRSNPILDLGDPGTFDEAGLGEPAVFQFHGWYWLLYTGRDVRENRGILFARSTDGVLWQRLPDHLFRGSDAWDSKVVCDPTVLVEGDAVRLWFGGGDVASPDENLHGQIGAAILRPLTPEP